MMNSVESRKTNHLQFALALMLILGLGVGAGQAQLTLDVGGADTIGDTTLTTSSLPPVGAWTADGGAAGADGQVYGRLNSPTVTVLNAGEVTLSFTHRYFIENDWDGGTVYVSVNGGAWTHVPTNAFTTNGYVKVLASSSSGGPFPALEATFTTKSAGYDSGDHITSVANLGTFGAGDTVAVQFVGGWDWGYVEAAPNWEITQVTVSDSAATLLDANFFGEDAGFTDTSDADLTGPWTYTRGTFRFELDADALTADRLVPAAAGSTIDLNDANFSVVILSGTLDVGDTFTLFDLSGGTTLSGAVGSIVLPGGTWDVSSLSTSGTITCLALPALLDEPFDYPTGNLNGKDGGTGFSGPWVSRRGNAVVTGINNFWGSLGTAGNRANAPSWNYIERPIGTTLSDAGVMANGSTLWFSFVMDVLGQNLANLDYNFALSAEGFYWDGSNNSYGDRTKLASGEGIGVSNFRQDIKGAIWQDNDTNTIAEATLADTSLAMTSSGAGSRAMIVGKIEWGATDTDPETLTLYAPSLDGSLGTPILDAWQTPPLDQSLFDQVSMEWKDGQASIDEIRFGPTSGNVMPPDATAPTVADISVSAGSPIYGKSTVQYTVSFNDPMDNSTVTASDFVNLGTAAITVGTVTNVSSVPHDLGVYTVDVTPTTYGTLQLQLAGVVQDQGGNALVVPVDDDAVITFSDTPSPRVSITVDSTASAGAGSSPVSLAFDASGSDKLVVAVTGEHGFNNADGNCTGITYDGTPLVQAVNRDPVAAGSDTTYNDIWYLDNPGLVHTGGVIVASVVTRGSVTAFALSGTAPGVGSTAISAPDSKSVSLTTMSQNSIVIASHGMGGNGNTADVNNVDTVAPLIETSALENGSLWDGHVTGYMMVAQPSLVTPTFVGGNLDGSNTIAAEFPAGAPLPATMIFSR